MSSVLLRSALAVGLAALSCPAFAAADFATCFTLTPGVSWSNADETITIAATTFAGQDAITVTNAGGGVSSATVHDRSGRQQLGTLRYGISAWGGDASAPVMTDTYKPAPTFPQNAKPGERFQYTGQGERTNHAEGSTAPLAFDGFSDYTFVGFENLEVEIDYQPRTFADTCHLSATGDGNRIEVWYAPGFGRIKFQRYSGDSLLIGDEIESIQAE